MDTKLNLKRGARPQAVSAMAVEHIRRLIESGELSPGDRLLPERQLAEKLEISRSSVREALAVLAGMGFISVSPRDGAYIRCRSLEDAVDPLAQILFREREDIQHMFEVRQIIETQAARLAAQRAEVADLERLRQLNFKVAQDVADGQPNDESDTYFHVATVETAKNPMLNSVMSALTTAMTDVYAPARKRIMSDPREARGFVREHEAILAAIAGRDAAAAETAMARHIEHARRRVEAY